MKRTYGEIASDIILVLIRPIVTFFLRREIKVIHSGDIIPRNAEPFIVISNHFNSWDAFVLSKNIKKSIRFVATEIAYLDLPKKIGMKFIAKTIRKRVGKSDVQAIRKVYEYLNKGYSIGIFPEGDNTFCGATIGIYDNIGRLFKKTEVDIVLCKQQGGYLSQPRWADNFSKNGIVHTHTSTLIKKEELENLTALQINTIIEKAIENNDYDFQREQMYDFKRKNRAEGIERLVYVCNNCNSVLTVFGKGHDILCSKCGKIGEINKYEFLVGNKFDNLVDYNDFQYSRIEEVINSEFMFVVNMNIVDTNKLVNRSLGRHRLHYKNKVLTLSNNKSIHRFEIEKIKYPVNTLRVSFSFDYEDITYNFTDIRHQFVLYEMCRYLNGTYKRK
mgnify:FL=1